MNVLDAIRERHSTRAFLKKDVDPEKLQTILETASWAPSGVNTQPWKAFVLDKEKIHTLSEALINARNSGTEPNPDYDYYPANWKEPYLSRRRNCGLKLYQTMGIGKKDKQQQMDAWCRNYRFFDAPTGLLFFLEQGMQTGSWLDMGMFMQNIMLAAKEFGLDTCPQASLAEYPDIVRTQLGIDNNWLLIAGMALGYADPSDPLNQYRLPRESVENFTKW